MAWSDAARAAAAEARRMHAHGGIKLKTARSIALGHVMTWPLSGSARGDRARWIKDVRGKYGTKRGRTIVHVADKASLGKGR